MDFKTLMNFFKLQGEGQRNEFLKVHIEKMMMFDQMLASCKGEGK